MSKYQNNAQQLGSKDSALHEYYDITGDGVLRAKTSKLSSDEGFRKYVADIFSTVNLVEKKTNI